MPDYEKWVSKCGRVTLYRGDCLDVMPTIPEASIESVLCDPPYGLKFMGKKWDHGVPGVPFWEATRRVLKPGAMLMAFGGTRTQHRLVCAIEDAGFEIRDAICWHYGSGFPKSHDISKGIDRAAGAERETGDAIVYGDGHVQRSRKSIGFGGSDPESDQRKASFPATPAAQTWNGYGTALKPATEIICLAMNPLDGTFAANALKHGVAGLNIDGGRIGSEVRENGVMSYSRSPGKTFVGNTEKITRKGIKEVSGRWPANVILDEAAAAELDEQSGVLTSGGGIRKPNSIGKTKALGAFGKSLKDFSPSSGGASRFFFCAKASKAERNAGLDGENHHPTCKPVTLLRYLARLTKTPTGGTVLDPFMGSGSTGVATVLEGRGFIGIEKEAEYFEIAKRRLALALAEADSDMLSDMEVV